MKRLSSYSGNAGTLSQLSYVLFFILVACLSEWFPPDGRNISTATGNLCQVVVAVGRDLYYLELNAEAGSEKIVQIRSVKSRCVMCTWSQ